MLRPKVLIWLIAMAVITAVGSACRADETAFRWEATPGQSLALIGPNGTIWRFNYAHDQSKPYFDPMGLVSGESLTWNQPPDHAWHHAFWFSWKTINGINYWENDPQSGHPLGRTTWKEPVVSTDPAGAARIELELTYAPSESAPVLRETRIIEVSAPSEDGQYYFDWDAAFRAGERDVVLDRTPIPPDPDGKPWGGYAGLSIRFAENMSDRQAVTDRGAAEFDPSGIHRSRGIACEYQGTVNGRPAGIAMLSHPGNPRHPAPWYAIRNNMSYLNPAFLAEEPYAMKARSTLRLRYRVVVHSGRWDSARLQEEATFYDRLAGREAHSLRPRTNAPTERTSRTSPKARP